MLEKPCVHPNDEKSDLVVRYIHFKQIQYYNSVSDARFVLLGETWARGPAATPGRIDHVTPEAPRTAPS
ncbi:hypothetical protein L505_0732 [Bordetella bronchiseptica F4563]|nr:hypothetical protein L505_0732 [Bordetella bronchiseptica F4563]